MMVHQRKVLVDGKWVIVDPKHDMYFDIGKRRIYTHYIPGAHEGKDALNYRLNGPYPVVMFISNYTALAQECIDKYGISAVLRRVPTRAKRIVVRAAEEIISRYERREQRERKEVRP